MHFFHSQQLQLTLFYHLDIHASEHTVYTTIMYLPKSSHLFYVKRIMNATMSAKRPVASAKANPRIA